MSKNDPSTRSRGSPAQALRPPHPDETVVPHAVWRLTEMGERAGLITPSNQRRVIDALCGGGRPDLNLDRTLDLYQCDRLDLFILVALLAAEGRSMSLGLLARETFSKYETLMRRVAHLGKRGIVSEIQQRSGDAEARLTHSGQALTVSLIYQLLNRIR